MNDKVSDGVFVPFVVRFIVFLGLILGMAFPVLSGENTSSSETQNIHVFDTQAQAFISLETWFQRLKQADYFLVGEIHNQAAHTQHFSQIISTLQRSGPDPIPVIFEMLESKEPKGIESINRAETLRLVRGWDPLIYDPFFETLKATSIPIAGALTQGERNQLFVHGKAEGVTQPIESSGSDFMPASPYASVFSTLKGIPEQVYKAIDQTIVEQHGAHSISADAARKMTYVQLGKDAKMAYLLNEARNAQNRRDSPNHGPVALYAGIYHVRKDRGVPLHLAQIENEGTGKSGMASDASKVLVAVFQHRGAGAYSKTRYSKTSYSSEQADYVLYIR